MIACFYATELYKNIYKIYVDMVSGLFLLKKAPENATEND